MAYPDIIRLLILKRWFSTLGGTGHIWGNFPCKRCLGL